MKIEIDGKEQLHNMPCSTWKVRPDAPKQKNTVTQEQIDRLWNSAQVKVSTVFGKTTHVSCKLPNGFVITESSSCVDQANYNEEVGFEICRDRIKDKLWELEGYVLQKELHAAKRNHAKEAAERFFKGEHFDEIAGANPTMLGGGSIVTGTINASEIEIGKLSVDPAFVDRVRNESQLLLKRVEEVKAVRNLQGQNGSWNYDHYAHGMYNGLELALSIMEGRQPEFKDAPVDWLATKKQAVPVNAVDNEVCCEPESAPVHHESIYTLTEALRALDKDYDNTARAKIIDRMLQVLGL